MEATKVTQETIGTSNYRDRPRLFLQNQLFSHLRENDKPQLVSFLFTPKPLTFKPFIACFTKHQNSTSVSLMDIDLQGS